VRCLTVLFALGLCCISTGAEVLDVYPDGSGPFPDLEQAVLAAQSGDSLRMGAGIFSGAGNRNIVLGGMELTIFSAGGDPDECVIDVEGEGRAFFVYSLPGTDVRIEGITVRGGDPGELPPDLFQGYGGGLAVNGLAPGGMTRVDRCVFEGNVADAGAGAFLYECEAAFTACRFHHNTATDGAGAYCGQCEVGDGIRFERCVLYANDYPSPSVGGYGAGIYFSHSRGRVTSCTLALNSAWLGGGLLVSTGSDVGVERCLVAFSLEGQGVAVNAGAVEISHCDIFGNQDGDWVGPIAEWFGIDCNMSVDPIFCDAAAGEFTLRDDSPCLPENSAGCGLIGALDEGCTATGVAILPADGHLRLEAPHPSPFRSALAITYALARSGRARLRVFDPAGRPVVTLVDEWVRGGEPRVAEWRGTDTLGRPLPGGVFFLRLEADGASYLRRAVLIR